MEGRGGILVFGGEEEEGVGEAVMVVVFETIG